MQIHDCEYGEDWDEMEPPDKKPKLEPNSPISIAPLRKNKNIKLFSKYSKFSENGGQVVGSSQEGVGGKQPHPNSKKKQVVNHNG